MRKYYHPGAVPGVGWARLQVRKYLATAGAVAAQAEGGGAGAAVAARMAPMARPGTVMGEDELQAPADVRGACVQVDYRPGSISPPPPPPTTQHPPPLTSSERRVRARLERLWRGPAPETYHPTPLLAAPGGISPPQSIGKGDILVGNSFPMKKYRDLCNWPSCIRRSVSTVR